MGFETTLCKSVEIEHLHTMSTETKLKKHGLEWPPGPMAGAPRASHWLKSKVEDEYCIANDINEASTQSQDEI